MSEKIKIFCHACDGQKYIEEKRYPDGAIIKAPCPECNGDGFVFTELWQEKQGVHSWQPTFPDGLAELVTVQDEGDFYKVKPTRFLGKINFQAINEIVCEYAGTYVSAGKDSHFRIPKK